MSLNDKLRIGGARLGEICFGLCIASTVCTLFCAFSPLIIALYIFVLVIPILVTLGTIFLLIDDYLGFFTSSTETFVNFSATAAKAMPYVAAFAAVTAVIACVLLLLDPRTKKHKSKVAGAAVCGVLAVLFAVVSKAVAL